MYIDNKILGIVGLSITAILLAAAIFVTPRAKADLVIGDRDYTLVTAHAGQGGDSLYVMDNRSGLMVVLLYDPNTRSLRPRAFTSVPQIFNGGGR